MFIKTFAAASLLALAGTASADVLFSQPWNGTAAAFASQNDTTGGNGSFATSFDDFVLDQASFLNGFNWTGVYFNPSVQTPIDGFTITLYNDNGGIPGDPFAAGFFTDYNETFLGAPDGFVTYSYSVSFTDFGPVAAGTYWVSFVPDLGFPPQWGWATSDTGTNNAYQVFFGVGAGLNANLAFDVIGDAVIPEPGTWALMIAGFGMVGGTVRARRRKTIVAA